MPSRSDTAPTTELVRHPLKARLLRVVSVRDLAPRFRRIVLAADDLSDFASLAADDHIKVFFPPSAGEKPALPTFGEQGPVFPESATRPTTRDYTPRRIDRARGELTLEFVIHGHGPASTWAANAQAGHWLGIAGPRGSRIVRPVFDWYLLAGDETALPAIGRFIEELPQGKPVHAYIEVDGPEHHIDLPARPGLAVQWLHRAGAEPGSGGLILDALRAATLPPQRGYAWLAAESSQMRAARAWLLDAGGFTAGNLHGAGYWKRGVADHDKEH
jgi:NADPH-dependent ferric siderophore reductase